MNKKKKEINFWKKYFNFPGGLIAIPPAIKHISFNCTDVDDEDLAYLVSRIKIIETLDLELTQISNAGIKEIATLQGLKELKLKDNYSIDNNCLPDLNTITSLEVLHLGHTSITIDGIFQLDGLTNLTQLLFSADDTNVLKDKMLLLHKMLPNCNFAINSVPYVF